MSLGLGNGDLFGDIIALSPGFMAPAATIGSPRLFIAHGLADPVLPIDRCSRRLVPALRRAGYEVLYREFEGGHSMPPAVVAEALSWFLGGHHSA